MNLLNIAGILIYPWLCSNISETPSSGWGNAVTGDRRCSTVAACCLSSFTLPLHAPTTNFHWEAGPVYTWDAPWERSPGKSRRNKRGPTGNVGPRHSRHSFLGSRGFPHNLKSEHAHIVQLMVCELWEIINNYGTEIGPYLTFKLQLFFYFPVT